MAYRFGPEALAKTVGQVHKAEAPSPEVALLNAECAVLATAEIRAKLGLLGKDQPESAILKALLVEKAKQPDKGSTEPRLGLEALSYDQGAMFVFKKLVTDAALERLKLAGSYDSQQAAAEAQLTFKFAAASLSGEIGISRCKVLPPNPHAKPESNHPGPECD